MCLLPLIWDTGAPLVPIGKVFAEFWAAVERISALHKLRHDSDFYGTVQ
jgi:hypothetical protein